LENVGGAGVGPDPGFEVKVLEENDEYIVETTEMGATVRRRKESPTTFYGHIDHPIKTRADWERYKQRLQPGSPGRIRKDLTPERIRQLNASPNPVTLSIFPFFFRLGFYTMGMERFLTAFHEEPDLIRDMFDTAGLIVQSALRTILKSVHVDFAYFTEDMAFKNGTLVSPRTYMEFWTPPLRPILAELHRHNVPVIAHWSSGLLEPLIPSLLEQGFNCIGPVERLAGMDALDLRRRYGRKLLLAGNIAKESLLAGPAAIDAELNRLMPLMREGGFLPTLDDMAPSECPFSHYRSLIAGLRAIELGGSGQG
jgi:uroporphyrinogen decarboxylase